MIMFKTVNSKNKKTNVEINLFKTTIILLKNGCAFPIFTSDYVISLN